MKRNTEKILTIKIIRRESRTSYVIDLFAIWQFFHQTMLFFRVSKELNLMIVTIIVEHTHAATCLIS